MTRHINILICILTLGFLACNNQTSKTSERRSNFDCNSLTDKKFIFEIAQSIVDKHDNEQIWNISKIDTTDFFTTEDFFTNSKTKNRIVLVGGSAGGSSGSARNLLILFSCSDTFKVLWAGQVGGFTQNDIADLNEDGLKEITINSGSVWMGECNDIYEIFNFKDGTQKILYTAHSNSVIDCGRDNLSRIYKQGDTLESTFDCSLLKIKDNKFEVKQIHKVKVHNGGHSDEEIFKNLVVTLDTTNIKLK